MDNKKFDNELIMRSFWEKRTKNKYMSIEHLHHIMRIEYLQNIFKLKKKHADTIKAKEYKGITHCWIENPDGTTQECLDLSKPIF